MALSFDLREKVAVISGASRGIGAAIAETYAEQGCSLVLTAQHGEALENVGARLVKVYGIKCLCYAADVTDGVETQKLYQLIFEKFGGIDILVANAGILVDGLIGMISTESINRQLAVNVTGALLHLQSSARLMRRKRAGSIILTTSIIGRFGNKGQMAYAASKAALIGAMMSASKELGPDGIRVNAIAPGVIDTDMTKNLSDVVRSRLMANISIGRIGTPSEVAAVALFLASDLASYVSGQVVGVDGGMVV